MKTFGDIANKTSILIVLDTRLVWCSPFWIERNFQQISLKQLRDDRDRLCRGRSQECKWYDDFIEYLTRNNVSYPYVQMENYRNILLRGTPIEGIGLTTFERRKITVPWYNCDISECGASLVTERVTYNAFISINFIRNNNLISTEWQEPEVLGRFLREYDERNNGDTFGDTKKRVMLSVNYTNDECVIFHCKKCHRLSRIDKSTRNINQRIEPQVVDMCYVCAAEERRSSIPPAI